MKKLICLLTTVVLCISLTGCVKEAEVKDVWENAIHKEDTVIGSGKTEISVKVIADDKTVNFKVNTDKTMLGDALVEHKLIDGDKEAYGLYVKVVNGIRADYNEDKAFWSISKNGEALMTGVDNVEIKSGDAFEFTYIKN